MKTSTGLISLAALGLIWGAIQISNDDQSPPAWGHPAVGKPLLSDAALSKVDRIEVSRRDRSGVVSEGEGMVVTRIIEDDEVYDRLTQLKKSENGWVIQNKLGLKANASAVEIFLRDLKESTPRRFLRDSINEALASKDIGQDSVTLYDASGATLLDIELGQDEGGSDFYFARVGDEGYFILESATVIAGDPLQWAITRPFATEEPDIKRVRLDWYGGGVPATAEAVNAGSPEDWQISSSEPVDLEALLGFQSYFTDTRFWHAVDRDSPIAPQALHKRLLSLEWETQSGGTVRVALFAPDLESLDWDAYRTGASPMEPEDLLFATIETEGDDPALTTHPDGLIYGYLKNELNPSGAPLSGDLFFSNRSPAPQE